MQRVVKIYEIEDLAEAVSKIERIPHLRVVLTPFCNMKCTYCRPGGEGYYKKDTTTIDTPTLIDLISFCGESGFRDIKLTGGEPMTRKDLEYIIAQIYSMNHFENIEMVTNAYYLPGRVQALRSAGLTSLSISLDTYSKERFKQITKVDGFERVISSIREAVNEELPTRINAVITKYNLDDVPKLVDISESLGVVLKLIDTMDILMEDDKWKDYNGSDWVPLAEVDKMLSDRIKDTYYTLPIGGLGTPMRTLELNTGGTVMLRDATVGTNYNPEICGNCSLYPCQDALISARLTHDGQLKTCLIRNDNLIDLMESYRKGDIDRTKQLISSTFDLLASAQYEPNKWKPKENGGNNGETYERNPKGSI